MNKIEYFIKVKNYMILTFKQREISSVIDDLEELFYEKNKTNKDEEEIDQNLETPYSFVQHLVEDSKKRISKSVIMILLFLLLIFSFVYIYINIDIFSPVNSYFMLGFINLVNIMICLYIQYISGINIFLQPHRNNLLEKQNKKFIFYAFFLTTYAIFNQILLLLLNSEIYKPSSNNSIIKTVFYINKLTIYITIIIALYSIFNLFTRNLDFYPVIIFSIGYIFSTSLFQIWISHYDGLSNSNTFKFYLLPILINIMYLKVGSLLYFRKGLVEK